MPMFYPFLPEGVKVSQCNKTTLQVDVNTMTNAKCSASDTAYSASDITSNMICARDTGKDSCQVILVSH